jgi:hypothetical protein
MLLALVVAFAGIAVFSPLHKHDLKSPTKCSLNNLDAQQTDGPAAINTLPALTRLGRSQSEDAALQPDRRSFALLSTRAPPQLFS